MSITRSTQRSGKNMKTDVSCTSSFEIEGKARQKIMEKRREEEKNIDESCSFYNYGFSSFYPLFVDS